MIKPIPGRYHNDYLKPLLINVDPLVPILTDSDGYVAFSGMHFSVYGSYG